MDSPIILGLSERRWLHNVSYQVLTIELTSPDRMIQPQDLGELRLPIGIDAAGGVVISGRAPIWLYGYLVHELHPTAWVACYDPRLKGAVVVATHSRQTQIGAVLPVDPSATSTQDLCPALLIVGPPDSGKSVLAYALWQALMQDNGAVYLQRAQWDGEGNWWLELGEDTTPEEREAWKNQYKGTLTDRFFPYHAQAILNLRRQQRLVIVDVGGKVQPEKQPLLEACSHYLIISSNPREIEPWHEFCRDRGNLQPVAVIHSSLDSGFSLHQEMPYLELTAGPWIAGQTSKIPPVLLDRIRSQCLSPSNPS
nr:CRISPR-associated ring nuclease Crn3/Csx3 [Prochlorothrix hollandica]